ncbi:MAG: heme exporter protein CcmB [Gammaproteobacteria bacterium]|nr:heme exporter protein CcmB [Gammaproteobacteria bacterium]
MNHSLTQAFWTLLRRDLLLTYRNRAQAINPLLFFVLVIVLFPFGVGPDATLLKAMAPGVIWVAALLSALLSLESIFRSDFDDGFLEQLVLSPHSLSALVLAKVFAHWMISGFPLLVVAPLLGVFLGMQGESIEVLVITLLIGTPVLSLIGAIGVALTVGLRQGGVILALLVFPLYIPVLIFATNAVQMAESGFSVTAQLSILAALFLLSLALAPLPAAAALKMSLS